MAFEMFLLYSEFCGIYIHVFSMVINWAHHTLVEQFINLALF